MLCDCPHSGLLYNYGQLESSYFPLKKVLWKKYNVFVNVPNQWQQVLTKEYGKNWQTPDMNVGCQNLKQQTVNQWIQELFNVDT